ncbi:MAG: SpoIIE family protein phosphatase [Thermoleophilaceae bacterium]
MTEAPILIVDDQEENLIALEAVLEPLGQRLVRAQSGEEALSHLLKEDFALILLDVQMPNLDGFQTATFIKQREKTRHIPIIFLTALSKELHHMFRGYSAGAVDYVVKPFDPMILRSKVQVFVDLYRKERELRQSEERFRTAFANAPIGVVLADAEAVIIEVNNNLATMLGRHAADLVGTSVGDMLHPDDREAALADYARLVAGELPTPYRREVRHLRADGLPVQTMLNSSLVRDAAGAPLHVIAQIEDITERKEAERERAARAKERAARAEAEAVAETMGRLQSVTDVALRHLTLNELLREVLGRIRDTMGVQAVGILLLGDNEAGETFASGAVITPEGKAEEGVRIPVARDVARRIAGAGEVVTIEEVHDPLVLHPLLKESGIVSVAAAPLAVEGRLHGVLQVGSTTRRKFTSQDAGLLQLIADRAALAVQHARLYEREHGIVETLQRALLPSRLPQLPGVQVAARYLPGGMGSDVGGDWYDVLPLEDGRIGVAIGDVAGHGLRAATLMGQLRNSLRAYAIEGHGPAAVVERLNRLVRDVEQGWMATLLYLVLSPDDSEVCFANAGHMPALALEAGDARFIEAQRGPPLGVGADGDYVEVVEEVRPGSTLIVYTDGLVEEPGVAVDLSLARLAETALAGPADPDELCDHLVREQLGSGQPRDDVAFVAIHTVPLSGEKLTLRLPAEPKALPSVRRALLRWLEEAGASEDEAYAVQLACHEACTNAIEHGYRFGEASFEVAAEVREHQLTVRVTDSGGWRGAGDADRGRGFALMEALMDTVDVTPGRNGTTVVMKRALGAATDGKKPSKKAAVGKG